MDIISAREITNPSLLKFKIGGAALVFEKAEDWKHYFKNLILNACQAVRDNRARSTSREHLHLGNILYASLVHAIVQMIDAFVQERKALSAARVDLRLSMSSTGVWKQDAELDTIVEASARFLSLYMDVNPSDAHLKTKLLVEFEIVWREIIDPFLGTHPLLCRHFSDGGYLSQELLDPESYAMLTSIRRQVIQNRQHENVAASSSGAGNSATE